MRMEVLMSTLVALVRIAFISLILLLGTLLMLLLMLLPLRVHGIRLSALPVRWLARVFLWTFNVHLRCSHPERLRAHHGLVFCNHLSYMDIVALLTIIPVRFLSAAGVRKLPLIGSIAAAIDTIYVNRGDQASRSAVRAELAHQVRVLPYPPVVIFPEGKIGSSSQLLPFRLGAFEIAHAEAIACLPCALWYEPLKVINYADADDNLPKAIWRLAQTWRSEAWLTVLERVESGNYGDAQGLMRHVRATIADVLPRS